MGKCKCCEGDLPCELQTGTEENCCPCEQQEQPSETEKKDKEESD